MNKQEMVMLRSIFDVLQWGEHAHLQRDVEQSLKDAVFHYIPVLLAEITRLEEEVLKANGVIAELKVRMSEAGVGEEKFDFLRVQEEIRGVLDKEPQ